MPDHTSPGALRRIVRQLRSAHARGSEEWIRRMEAPSTRGPGSPR